MDIGIFTIAYNGYGRFALQWCNSISKLTRKPTQATIALFGENHGLTDDMRIKCSKVLGSTLKIIHKGELTTKGAGRNKAVEDTPTEWIMLLDIDDIILPIAIEEFEKHDKHDIDAIACAYREDRLDGSKRHVHPPKTLSREALLNWRTSWLTPYCPFRRQFWEKHPYFDGEYPNIPLMFDFAIAGAKFARVDVMCACHLRRSDSSTGKRTPEDDKAIYKFLDSHVLKVIADEL